MKRSLIVTVVVISALVALGGVAFTFGTPQAPDVVAPATAPGAVVAAEAAPQPAAEPGVEPEATARIADGGSADAASEVPAPDPSVPLAIEIPGCVCHSDDPKVVEEHAEYRMNQCAGCHAGGTPTGME